MDTNYNYMEQLAVHIAAQPDYKPAEHCYVSVYRHEQCFGGPEEGGWWYDRYELVGSKPFVNREDAEQWLADAKAQIEQQNRADAPLRAKACASLPDEDNEPCPADCPEGFIPNDWSDGGELKILVEDTMGHLDNMHEPRPQYE